MRNRRLVLWTVLPTLLACGGSRPAAAQSFYEGKTVRIIVGLAPGGGFDTYARVVARHIGRHVPGNPTFIVENMTGAGTPPEIPSWGNIMAEGRTNFQVGPWMILFPGTFLALVVLAVNLVGDGLRDLLDPRFARRL